MKILLRAVKITACVLVVCMVVGLISVLAINGRVVSVGKERLLTAQQAAELDDVDCILVLGCGVKADGTPSLMLQDRLERSLQLYQLDVAPKLLMSGDHGRQDYDEVGTMKEFVVDAGVPSSDVFMDHAGFSTYESMYRAKDVFQAGKIVIVSQEYHLYRAIYIAQALGLDAYGVAADGEDYAGQWGRDVREVLARVKDFFTSIWKPQPTYLGDAIPVNGNGDITNDTTA
ncbi:YdcF family protein [Pseudoflavonifractor capillosus]|uniref:SanA/YdcF family protein n=1 Tax=Pseudoflavonifractor capillosus TaxID=106588 RepID=UPI00195648F8|nr:ElyC/SanA/YdcF family protein [Pseudoflavonifractor capillosus]MBM6896384.1 YdcF family protein [Pseudoflavonifractor capillosus]